MSPVSINLANKIINQVFSTGHATFLGNTTGVWVQLHTGDPGVSCTANVLASCPRFIVPFGTAGSGTAANNATASVISSASGTVTHISYWDSSDTASANPLFYGALTASKQIGNAGDTVTVAVGALTVNVSTS